MPYIPEQDRPKINPHVDRTAEACRTVGELTYALTRLCLGYLPDSAGFADYAEVVAALEETKFDLHRRRIFRYEAGKQRTNGDIFDPNTTTGGW